MIFHSLLRSGRALLLAGSLAVLSACSSVAIHDMPLDTLKAKYTNTESRFVEIDGTEVHYRVEGEGPTLVLVHGMVSSLHTWDGWTARLKDRYRVVRFDVPGFGLTGPIASGQYNVEEYSAFIDKFLKKVGVTNCVIAGNSLGGYIAWNYAIRHPEVVEKLVLLDAPAFQQEVPWVVKMAQLPLADSVGTKFTPRFMVGMNLRDVYYNKGLVTDDLIDRYYEMALRPGNRAAYLKIFREMLVQSKQDAPGVEKITMPTLIMWGKQDPWVPFPIAMRWLSELKHAQYVFYDGVGHMPMEEIPMRTAHDVDRFIRSGSVGTETIVKLN